MSDERYTPDEDDDSDAVFARRDDDPRAETGYQPAPPRPVSAAAPTKAADPRDRLYFCEGGGEDCKGYKLGALMLQRPGGGGPRIWCAGCVGRVNLATVERTADAIRALKAATLMGHAEDERRALHELTGLVGAQQANATAAAIRQGANEKPAGKGGRR